MAFVRLSRGRYLGNITQVPLPVRFMFVLLAPQKSGVDYKDVGRSISTLMSNKVRHSVTTSRCTFNLCIVFSHCVIYLLTLFVLHSLVFVCKVVQL